MKNDIGNTDKASVLVADDESVIRDLFEGFLDKQGYEVSTAEDGLEALGKIKEKDFDMLILDLKMPKMSGMELLDKMKQLEKDMIVIIVTGYATINTAKDAMKQGCFDYITKPFDVENVGIVIKRALDMRRLAEEKKKLEEQFRTAEKLASLAQLGRGVAHEVNTVLTSTRLFLEIIEPKLSRSKDVSNIGLILEEMERVERLIKRFLTFAKPGAPEFVKTNINEVIKRSLDFFKYRFDKHKIDIFEQMNKDVPKVLCDPAEMEEVFLNIYSNAIDAMPDGGQLTVKSWVAAENAVIAISNTGAEISPEDMKKLYNPFFTTKKHGTGLGLAIVHRIIDEHKGVISIVSEKNKGTTVRIEMPVDKGGA